MQFVEPSTDARPPRAVSPPAAGAPAPSELEQLVRAHQGMVWRYLRLLGASAVMADDLMQDTFLCAARRLQAGERLVAAESFLRATARNLLLGAVRKEWRSAQRRIADADAVDRLVAADPTALGDARLDALQSCRERLQGRARAAVESHYIEGRSYDETAGRLGMRLDGLKSLLRRTREALRRCVRNQLRDPSNP